MTRGLVLGVFVLLASATASAGPLPRNGLDGDDKGWFYNRPGVTPLEVVADLEACRAFGGSMTAGSSGAGAAYGLIGALLEVALDAAVSAGPVAAYADDCMIGRGYRRFDTEDENIGAFRTRFEAMDAAARTALVSSESPPEGSLAREWVNSYWLSSVGDAAQPPASRRVAIASSVTQGSVRKIGPVRANEAIALGAGDAVLVMSVRPDSRGERPFITFTRDNAETGRPELTPMGAQARLRWPFVEVRAADPPQTSTQMVLVVPAGTYSLHSAKGGGSWTQFCLGTVAFTVQPGEVVHLGEFVVRSGSQQAAENAPPALFGLRIDAGNIDAGRAALARAPELATQLSPVAYRNGAAHVCQGPVAGIMTPVYGFDMPGAATPWAIVPPGSVTPSAPTPPGDEVVALPAEPVAAPD